MNPYRPRKRRCTVINLLYWTLVLVLAAAVFHLQSLYLSCRATSNHDSASEEMHKALNEELQSAKAELAKAKTTATNYMNKFKSHLRQSKKVNAPATHPADAIDRGAAFEMVRHALFASGKKFDRDGKMIIQQRGPPQPK